MVPRKIRAGGEEVLIRRDAAAVLDSSFIKISFIYHRILLDPSKPGRRSGKLSNKVADIRGDVRVSVRTLR